MEDSKGGVTVSAMLGKLLDSISGRKHATPKENILAEDRARQLLHPAGLSVPVLNQSRIRVVVFRDEKGVKQPVFDSQQINSDDGGEEPCSRSLCDMRYGEHLESSLSSSSGAATSTTASSHSAGWASQSGKTGRSRRGFPLVKRPSTDSELLGEMMFGSMPMKVIGNTVKVHYIRSTDQLMLSKVFTSAPKPLGQCSLTDFSDSCPLSSSVSSSSGRGSHRSFSADPRGLLSSHRRISPDSLRPHSTSTLGVPISHSPSLQPSPPLSSSPRSPPSPINSYNNPLSLSSSLTRRIQRSRTTSLENPSELYRKVLKPLDQHSSSSSNGRRKRKYAIGFIICLSELGKPDIRHFQSFLFSHFTLIDAHLERLKIGVEEAYDGRKSSQAAAEHLTRAYSTFLEDFMSLYKAPRIESPVWLSLVSCVGRRKQVCAQFMEELSAAITDMDTRENKYFLSSLLTAVLSHHLAWVFTVTRQHPAADSNSRHGKHFSKSLGVLAESHPYNPLWAQLGDLLGAVGFPLKISRTVISGQSMSAVSRLLYLLTYFIRCSEVEPGFTPDVIPASPLAMQNVKIPSSTHTSADDLINQLDENDVFGSRASSVTVMSDPDRASLFSPFASPVNMGMDTPIIRTYPFGIRTTPHSTAGTTPGSDIRKGSQSESDSLDSLHLQHVQLHARGMGLDSSSNVGTGMGATKKVSSLSRSGDLSMSQSSQSSLKKQSPLLYSSGSATRLDPSCFASGSCELPVLSNMNPPLSCDFIGEMAGNSCCSAAKQKQNFVCPDVSQCPIGKEDYVTFDPTSKPLLSPEHTHFSLPSHTSSSSLDSGYDQSLSLTDSCRDSCTEFTSSSYHGVGPCSFRSGTYANYKMSSSCKTDGLSYSSNPGNNIAYTELDLDSGLGRNRSSFFLKPPQQHLEDSQDQSSLEDGGQISFGTGESDGVGRLTVPLDKFSKESLTASPQTSASSGSLALYRTRNSEEMSVASVFSMTSDITSDPECSLKGSKRKLLSFGKGSLNTTPSTSFVSSDADSKERKDDEDIQSPMLPSPLSPDPTNSQLDLDADISAPVDSLSLSSDPTKALPPRKLRNHFRNLSGNVSSRGESLSPRGPDCPSLASETSVSISQCSQVMQMQSSTSNSFHSPSLDNHSTTQGVFSPSPSLPVTTSLTQSARHTSATHAQSNHLQDSHSSSSFSAHITSDPISPRSHTSATSLSSSPGVSPPHVKSQQHLSLNGPESPYGSESDSGRGTKISLHTTDSEPSVYVQAADFDVHPQIRLAEPLKDDESRSESLQASISSLRPDTHLNPNSLHGNGVRASSSPPLIGLFRSEDEEEKCSLGWGECRSFPVPSSSSMSNLLSCRDDDPDRDWSNTFLSLPAKKTSEVQRNGSAKDDQSDERKEDEDPMKSLSTHSLKKYRHNPSLLHQQLHDHDRSLLMGYRPPALERFGNFEDVPLPDLEEFHLDTPTDYHPHGHEEGGSHRQLMSDFGHSLFVGVSPRYLSDFVLHGTTQSLDQGLQDKLVQDLAHAIKYPVIDEPVEIGVGIVASTDTWSVKLHAVTKSLQTNDVLVGSANMQPSRAVRQMLASIKNMHALSMPADFCLSYLEDSLMSLNDQSVLLANALLEKGGLELELNEILPSVMEGLSLSQSDLSILLPLAAINSVEPDLSARLNHLHMQKLLGKHFI